jgi:hypothetical protein
VDGTRLRSGHDAPHWMRMCVHSFLILSVFAMHNVLVSDGGQLTSHHEQSMATTESVAAMGSAASSGDDPAQAVAPKGGHGPLGEMSNCCGLLMLCLAMIMGVGALLFVRRKVGERVLWRIPPPSRLVDVLRPPPFQGLTPFERSSILRC